jgi:hypothetical protein
MGLLDARLALVAMLFGKMLSNAACGSYCLLEIKKHLMMFMNSTSQMKKPE